MKEFSGKFTVYLSSSSLSSFFHFLLWLLGVPFVSSGQGQQESCISFVNFWFVHILFGRSICCLDMLALLISHPLGFHLRLSHTWTGMN